MVLFLSRKNENDSIFLLCGIHCPRRALYVGNPALFAVATPGISRVLFQFGKIDFQNRSEGCSDGSPKNIVFFGVRSSDVWTRSFDQALHHRRVIESMLKNAQDNAQQTQDVDHGLLRCQEYRHLEP